MKGQTHRCVALKRKNFASVLVNLEASAALSVILCPEQLFIIAIRYSSEIFPVIA